LQGQTSDFHASCGKISMVNFQKENNVIAHIREILVKVNTEPACLERKIEQYTFNKKEMTGPERDRSFL